MFDRGRACYEVYKVRYIRPALWYECAQIFDVDNFSRYSLGFDADWVAASWLSRVAFVHTSNKASNQAIASCSLSIEQRCNGQNTFAVGCAVSARKRENLSTANESHCVPPKPDPFTPGNVNWRELSFGEVRIPWAQLRTCQVQHYIVWAWAAYAQHSPRASKYKRRQTINKTVKSYSIQFVCVTSVICDHILGILLMQYVLIRQFVFARKGFRRNCCATHSPAKQFPTGNALTPLRKILQHYPPHICLVDCPALANRRIPGAQCSSRPRRF